ncbi:MAG: SMI1/KNR4 family protein [Candidatus Endonucleobacter bathymodioli]|uniref:SMI1/KNR4 family protein n=1 Tax=Candidatus Endonucleibacter bathymodioli TaxID=539814 RepID=A0AA90P062_9GAMM|nr:SMI1/KNR4 family protein [Candidatus Endonucleobacter bathymodioli]
MGDDITIESSEDVIDMLRNLAVDIPVLLKLPVDDDLLTTEETILMSLPYDLREFLLTVSDVVYGSLEPVTVADPCAHTYLPDIASQAWSIGVPRHLIPICQVDDSYYCIDGGGEVSLWTVGGDSPDIIWESIWHWAQNIWLNS